MKPEATDVKSAIEHGDVAALRALLAEDPSRANTPIRWGKGDCILTEPLHYVSDMLFAGTLARGSELPLIDAMLEAGADVHYQKPNHGETPLIGAASLGAEDVGLRLLEAGARPDMRGLFGETALHWAATIGADRLVGGLIAKGADVNVRDKNNNATPLGWAEHGASEPPPGNTARHKEVIARLIAAGAQR